MTNITEANLGISGKLFVLIFILISCQSKDYDNPVDSGEDRLVFFHSDKGTLKKVDKYRGDSLISSALYDSTGGFLKSTYRPEFIPRKGVIQPGEEYEFDVGFSSEPLGRIRVIVGYYDKSREKIGDTLINMILPEKIKGTLSLDPKYIGKNIITGKIEEYFIFEEDSVKVGYTNFFEFETSFLVEK